MAYNKQKILEQAIAAIKKHELTTIAEVLLYLPITEATIYLEEWKVGVLEPIKKELEAMRTKLKEQMKKKWRKSDSAILQIASFKLMATEEEREVLNPPRVQGTIKGDGNFDVNLNI